MHIWAGQQVIKILFKHNEQKDKNEEKENNNKIKKKQNKIICKK